MNETELLKAFKEYKGYEPDPFDIFSNFEFLAFCAGYKLKEKENVRINN